MAISLLRLALPLHEKMPSGNQSRQLQEHHEGTSFSPKTELISARCGHNTRLTQHSDGLIVEVETGEETRISGISSRRPWDHNTSFRAAVMSSRTKRFKEAALSHAWLDCPELQAPLILRTWEPDSGWYDQRIPWRVNPWKKIRRADERAPCSRDRRDGSRGLRRRLSRDRMRLQAAQISIIRNAQITIPQVHSEAGIPRFKVPPRGACVNGRGRGQRSIHSRVERAFRGESLLRQPRRAPFILRFTQTISALRRLPRAGNASAPTATGTSY
jgi:hypothetical protein